MKKIILVALVVLVAAGVSTALLLRSTSSPAKLALESANSTGASPFTSTVAAPAPSKPMPPPPVTPTTGPTTGPQPVSGATPGLYGGTGNQAVCNRNQMAGFLMANPAKAAAWVAAQNSDPTLRWSGGTSLTVAQIPQYLNELTPITLLTDTRVTNNGYVNGQPVPYQAVLQAGTAVFVDQYGVPRIRCACGNPLLRSIALTSGYVPAGTPWHGYGHSVTIIQSATVITNLTLVNVNVNVNVNNNTTTYVQPTGGGNVPVPPTPTPTPTVTTPIPTPTTPTPTPTTPTPTPTVTTPTPTPTVTTPTPTPTVTTPTPTPTPTPTDTTPTPILSTHSFSGTSPGQIDLSGDASYIITGITWSSWGPDTATGTGTSNIQGCVPNCAQGSETPVTTTITLSNVQGGQFTQFSATRNGDTTSGATSEIMGAEQ